MNPLMGGQSRFVGGGIAPVTGVVAVAITVLFALAAIAGTARATTAYSVIDLGTLDSPMPMSWSYGLSESGQVFGQSNGATPSSSPGFSWTESGGMVSLGTLGGRASAPTAVNEAGQVVGRSLTADSVLHAFSWTRVGGIVDLGTLGGARSWATDVNNDGVVVGWSEVADGSQHAFVWTQADGMVDLGTFGGSFSTAASINDAGQVVGTATTASASGHAFLWTKGVGMTDLGTLGGVNANPRFIDENGHVAGVSQTPGGNTHLFWWTPSGGMYDAGTLGGSFVQVLGMNDHDQIVGVDATSGGQAHAFFWSPASGMVDLGTLGGVASGATDVNNAGKVVGTRTVSYFPREIRIFSWTQAEGMVDLGTIPAAAPNPQPAINDAGQISSTAFVGSEVHAVLLVERTDTTPPVINVPPDISASATSATGAVVAFTVTATDAVDGPVPVVCTPPSGSTFPIGTTTVVCTAKDAAVNYATASFLVSVIDTTPPQLTVSVTPTVLWPPNHGYITVQATVNVADDVDPSPILTVLVACNEPDNGDGDGNTVDDVVVVDQDTFELRAERNEHGSGRIYTITYTATDASGNSAAQSATVTVPLEQ